MNRWIQKLFSNARVQRQLVTTFLFTISIPLLGIGLFLLVSTSRNLTQHYQKQADSDNLRVKSVLLNTTLSIYNIAESLSVDTSLAELLTADYASTLERSSAVDGYRRLKDFLAQNASIETLTVYSPNSSLGNTGNFQFLTNELKETSWYAQAASSVTPFWRINTRLDLHKQEHQELTLFYRIPLIRSKEFAVVSISVSDNYLRNLIENTGYQTILSINEEPCFYHSDRSLKGTPVPLVLTSRAAYYQLHGTLTLLDGSHSIGAVTTLVPYCSSDTVYIITLDRTAQATIFHTTLAYGLLVAAAFCLPFLLFYLFSRYFSARIVTLRNAIHQAGHGDYHIIDHFQGNDELSEAFGDLKIMIKEIQEKQAEVYRAQLTEQTLLNQQQEMEFKLLASQINPHFLYNTLETIRMKAFTAGNRDVAKAIKLLGKSLRYVLENTGTASTTLDRELSYIDTYLSIQRLRFGDQVSYVLDIPSQIKPEDYQILPLLLQPVVENAFSHGLEENDHKGEIQISIREKDASLFIQIKDNGSGMTQEQLEAIAPLIGYNSSYLGKIFTKNVGENFNSYLDRVRIEHSKALLLEDNCRVYEISERVGYKNVDYFHKKFKKYTGMSPAEFRKNQGA